MKIQQACAAAYQADNTTLLKQMIDRYLFNAYYPSGFIRGIEELSINSIHGVFKDIEVYCGNPYLIRDRLIYGEFFQFHVCLPGYGLCAYTQSRVKIPE